MSTTIDTKLANFFNSYLFRNVWNEPSKEYRRNIRPVLISDPIANSNIKLDWKRYDLPTAEKYHVYYIPETTMSGITFKAFPDWVTGVEFMNSSKIEVRFHNDDGIMLPRERVFLVNNPEKPGVLIAIPRELSRSLHGQDVDYHDLLVAFYYDSDHPGDVVINTYTMDGGTDINAVYTDTLDATSVYLNGILVDVQSVDDINVADAIVEVVKDGNIVDTFDIDLTQADEKRNFISTVDGQAKTIIHIPKSANPINEVISHNTCDLFIFPRNGATAHRNGRFFHRAIEDYSFSQITHNDFAIPDAIINSYVDTLETDEFVLRVQVKTHSKDNILIRDKNYLHLLYTHDDATILDFFEGVGPEAFDFWKADHLEASEYTKLITDTPNFVDVTNLPDHIDALGYYTSIALISNRVKSIELEEFGGEVSHRFIVPIPVIFESIRVYPSVFLNGIRLADNLVAVNSIVSGSALIDIDASVTLVLGDDVKVELFEDIGHNIVEVRPTATYSNIDVVDDNFVLYEVLEPVTPVQGITETYDRTFEIIEDLSTVCAYVDSVGGRYLAFHATAYDRIFVVAQNVGFEHRNYNIDTLLANNDPIVFDLTATVKSIDFEPPFELDTHTGKTESTGDLYDPEDEEAEIQYPAWHLMDGNTDWDVPHRWVTTLRAAGNSAVYDLAVAHQNTYWLIGYRIGAMPNMNDALRASELPINYQVRVDGNLVVSKTNEWWYKNPEVVHTHMLSTPVLVDAQVEFHLNGIQTPGAFLIQTDVFEPIFSDATEVVDLPLLGDLTCIPYLNGKELVENVDYHLADIQDPSMGVTPHLSGRQLVITNTSYLEVSDNVVDVMILHTDMIGETRGYIQQSYLGDVNSNPRWFDELSMVAVDGLIKENISTLFGTVEVEVVPDEVTGELVEFPVQGSTVIDPVEWYIYGTPTLAEIEGITTLLSVNRTLLTQQEILPPISDSGSIVVRFKTSSGNRQALAMIRHYGPSEKYGVQLYLEDDKIHFVHDPVYTLGATNGVHLEFPLIYSDDEWHTLTGTFDADNVKLYVDGDLVESEEATGVFTADHFLVLAGKSTGYMGVVNWQFLGELQGLKVFDRALSQAEVTALVTTGDATAARKGAPYVTRTVVPANSKAFIDRYHIDDDSPVLEQLTAYFRQDVPEPSVVLIPYSHRVVSIMTHMVVRDMLTGTLVVPLDPSDQVILDALVDYDYLRQYDIAFDAETEIDWDFVDVQAMYTDQLINDPVLYQQVHRVIDALLTDSVEHLRPDHEE